MRHFVASLPRAHRDAEQGSNLDAVLARCLGAGEEQPPLVVEIEVVSVHWLDGGFVSEDPFEMPQATELRSGRGTGRRGRGTGLLSLALR